MQPLIRTRRARQCLPTSSFDVLRGVPDTVMLHRPPAKPVIPITGSLTQLWELYGQWHPIRSRVGYVLCS